MRPVNLFLLPFYQFSKDFARHAKSLTKDPLFSARVAAKF
jgi:hypothetical protein